MKVSYLQPNAPSPFNGKPQKVGAEYTGTKLKLMDLEDVFEMCKKLPLGHEKRVDGAIFPMLKDTLGEASLGYYDKVYYDGVIFVDLDHLTKDMAETIFNGFEKLYTKYPFYYAIQYSSSYYIRPDSDDVGLHIYMIGPKGNGKDYVKYSRFAMATTAELVRIEFGIDLFEYHKNILKKGDKVLDTSICKISQRFYLYHSDYKLNPHCFPMSEKLYDKNVYKLTTKYNWVIINNNDDKIAEFDTQYALMGKVITKIRLSFQENECAIANFLANNGWDVDKIVAALFAIDSRSDDEEYMAKHKGSSRLEHFRQIARTAQHESMTESQRDYAISLLRRCGLIVEEDKPNKYELKPYKVIKL